MIMILCVAQAILKSCDSLPNNGFIALAEGCPHLKQLYLQECMSQLEDDAIVTVVKTCKELELLDISACTKLTHVSLEAIGEYAAALQHLALDDLTGVKKPAECFEVRTPLQHHQVWVAVICRFTRYYTCYCPTQSSVDAYSSLAGYEWMIVCMFDTMRYVCVGRNYSLASRGYKHCGWKIMTFFLTTISSEYYLLRHRSCGQCICGGAQN